MVPHRRIFVLYGSDESNHVQIELLSEQQSMSSDAIVSSAASTAATTSTTTTSDNIETIETTTFYPITKDENAAIKPIDSDSDSLHPIETINLVNFTGILSISIRRINSSNKGTAKSNNDPLPVVEILKADPSRRSAGTTIQPSTENVISATTVQTSSNDDDDDNDNISYVTENVVASTIDNQPARPKVSWLDQHDEEVIEFISETPTNSVKNISDARQNLLLNNVVSRLKCVVKQKHIDDVPTGYADEDVGSDNNTNNMYHSLVDDFGKDNNSNANNSIDSIPNSILRNNKNPVSMSALSCSSSAFEIPPPLSSSAPNASILSTSSSLTTSSNDVANNENHTSSSSSTTTTTTKTRRKRKRQQDRKTPLRYYQLLGGVSNHENHHHLTRVPSDFRKEREVKLQHMLRRSFELSTSSSISNNDSNCYSLLSNLDDDDQNDVVETNTNNNPKHEQVPKENASTQQQQQRVQPNDPFSLRKGWKNDISSQYPTTARTTNTHLVLHKLCASPTITLDEFEHVLSSSSATTTSSSTAAGPDSNTNSAALFATKDSLGRLPLHILGDNDILVSTKNGKIIATMIAKHMMQNYPDSITTLDDRGRMPFVSLIEDWTTWVYTNHIHHDNSKNDCDSNTFYGRRHDDTAAADNNNDTTSLDETVLPNSSSMLPNRINGRLLTMRSVMYKDEKRNGIRSSSMNHYQVYANEGRADAGSSSNHNNSDCHHHHKNRHLELFPKVVLWDAIEWCFSMLSIAMEILSDRHNRILSNVSYDPNTTNDSNNNNNHQRYHRSLNETLCSRWHYYQSNSQLSLDPRKVLVKHILTIVPDIIKTLLLITQQDNGSRCVREQIFTMSIVRRLLFCPESIGTWFTVMLRHKGIPSKRAVDYLVLISKLSINDYTISSSSSSVDNSNHTRTTTSITPQEQRMYNVDKNRLLYSIDQLGSRIASLVELDKYDLERASNTTIVWHIMSQTIARPFLVGIVLMDLSLHVILMLAFYTDTRILTQDLLTQDAKESVNFDNVPFQTILFICSHYILRKFCEVFSLSNHTLREHFRNFWTILDIVLIILTLSAVLLYKHGRYFYGILNIFVTGLLWMKVLGFLKIINKRMATFMLSLTAILKELRYFFIVLLGIIFMFGDMMVVVVTSYNNGQLCIENFESTIDNDGQSPPGPISSFCSAERRQAYLRVYSLLLGDFELDDYNQSAGTVTLFVLCTFMGVYILASVLIALVSDSYEAACMKSRAKFTIARVSFIAQQEALEDFLRPGTATSNKNSNNSNSNNDNNSNNNNNNTIRQQQHNNTNYVYMFHSAAVQSRNNSTTILSFTSIVCKWMALLSIFITAMHSQWFLVSRAITLFQQNDPDWVIMTLIVCLFCTLATSLWFILSFVMEGTIPSHLYRHTKLNQWTYRLAKHASILLFDTNNSSSSTTTSTSSTLTEDDNDDVATSTNNNNNNDVHNDNYDPYHHGVDNNKSRQHVRSLFTNDNEPLSPVGEWNGRMQFIEQTVRKQGEQIRNDIIHEIMALERRLINEQQMQFTEQQQQKDDDDEG